MQTPTALSLVVVLDWIGTFVFALSGGLLGVRKRFDLFGVVVLACVAAVAGGIARDLLIGAVPPAAIRDPRYLVIACAGGLTSFLWYSRVKSLEPLALFFDAIGLGLFAVVGAAKAMDYGISPFVSIILGILSGVGGGVVRDLLAGSTPYVLRSELYALAALAAGVIVTLGRGLGVPAAVAMLVGGFVCVVLRWLAINRGWRAPVADWVESRGD